ncbi:hypothetical protein KVT40_001494 [Elsinoe batatas]|uniref:BZIP domain-containing protein n=1 Tax=Elsinoe batatas TaxID=2601811 RepID=A0A8K0L9B5_9PEZI|nr:hypothetical protein KVT40_001494 [Elsinoe batatas]
MATVAATMTTTALPSKGRKRKAAEADIDEKPRGRPRKNSKDESAAERRRTQIRLAQRAYRQRKETTIDELRQRVSELTTTIEMMNRSLQDFAKNANRRGLPPQTQSELDEMVQKLAPFVTTARNPGKFPHVPGSELIQNISAVSVDPMNGTYNDVTESAIQDEHVDIGMGYSVMLNGQDMSQDTSQDYQETDTKLSSPIDSHSSHQDYQAPHPVPFLGPSLYPSPVHSAKDEILTEEQQLESQLSHIAQPFLDTSNYEASLVPRSRSLIPQRTYAQFEKSFARRLQRGCIETGWELINDPSRAPQTYNRVFRLTQLLGRSHTVMRQAFALALKRTINDTLDSVQSPLSHVGGAGLHFLDDRSGCRRTTPPAPNAALLDTIASTIPGFEGEWLDPHDVQGYLHQRGIKVDGANSFIHARLPISYLTSPAHLAQVEAHIASLDPSTPPLEAAEEFHRRFLDAISPARITDRQAPPNNASTRPSTGNLDLASLGLYSADLGQLDLGSLTDLMDSPALNFFTIPGTTSYEAASPPSAAGQTSSGTGSEGHSGGSAGSAGSASSVTSVESLSGKPAQGEEMIIVTIEVAKLMKGLVLGSVCLGRAPGFRREMVDACVRASVVMSF